MGTLCCSNSNKTANEENEDDETNDDGPNKKFNYDKLRKRIKDEIMRLHSHFKANIGESDNDLIFTMERIKIALSEFADACDSHCISVKTSSLEMNDFIQMEEFLVKLEKVNSMKIRKEQDYIDLLNKYKDLHEKVTKTNLDILDSNIILEDNENDGDNK